MAATVSSPIKMSTLQLQGDINWAFNDYAQEPGQIGTKHRTPADSSKGLEIVLKMRLIAVGGGKQKRRGGIKMGLNYRVPGAGTSCLNGNSQLSYIFCMFRKASDGSKLQLLTGHSL